MSERVPITPREVAKLYDVPPWLVDDSYRPAWWERVYWWFRSWREDR